VSGTTSRGVRTSDNRAVTTGTSDRASRETVVNSRGESQSVRQERPVSESRPKMERPAAERRPETNERVRETRPTAFYELTDYYKTTTDAKLGSDYNVKTSPNGEFTYQLNTPLKAIGSVGFIIGKYGLISGDYEYVDYSKTRLRAPDYTFSDENSQIRKSFQSTYNLRLGTEWRVSAFSLRGGYSIYGSPYASDLNDAKLSSYSFGVGYSEGNLGLDLAYVHTAAEKDYYLYASENFTTKAAKQEINGNHFALTLRAKF
jgi:hypothetical protein